jgi:hypothetical protein
MNIIWILLTVSALVGLVFGIYFKWVAIVFSGLVIAIAGAAALQSEGFCYLAGIAIIVVCLTVNQITYLIGAALVTRRINKISLPHE